MKILFTKSEYRTLFDMIYIAEWMLTAFERPTEAALQPYAHLAQKIYSHAKEMGWETLVDESPKDNEYWFAYFIRISNVGAETAQLMSRHWVITNTDGEEEEVRGEGVVGEQPMLTPGAVYNYNSFCHLKTSVGTMHGEYTMVTPSGDTFEARIAPFTLAVPNALN